MPCASHTKAAEDHEAAAKAHHAAADLHSKGDHSAALEKSADAKCCCDTAQKSTEAAHEKKRSAGREVARYAKLIFAPMPSYTALRNFYKIRQIGEGSQRGASPLVTVSI